MNSITIHGVEVIRLGKISTLSGGTVSRHVRISWLDIHGKSHDFDVVMFGEDDNPIELSIE